MSATYTQQAESKFMRVDEVARLLDVSESHAYRVMRALNLELTKEGKITTAGRVSRKYLMERIYC